MKRLKTFKDYHLNEARDPARYLTPEQIDWCNRHIQQKWWVNRSGEVRVTNNLTIRGKTERFEVQFAPVKGNFDCDDNDLTSLQGSPQSVGGYFGCSKNKLTSLEGAPQSVGGDFTCYENKLTSLKGAPQSVEGKFDCSKNNLTSLEGAPTSVDGYFKCSDNNLTSLEGAPTSVGGYFGCSGNKLTSLEGAPQSVGDYFYSDDISIKWNVDGWLKGLEKRPGLFGPLLDDPDLIEPHVRDPEMLVKVYPYLSSQTQQELDKRLGLDSGSVQKLKDLSDLGFF